MHGSQPNLKGMGGKKILHKEGEVALEPQDVQVLQNAIMPSGVIGFVQVKENTDSVFIVDKTFTNDGFQTEESINRGVPSAKPKLVRRKESMGFKKPHEPIIHHWFQDLTKANSEGNRVIVKRIRVVLAWLCDGNDHSLPPRGRKDMTKPNSIIKHQSGKAGKRQVFQHVIMDIIWTSRCAGTPGERSRQLNQC